MIKTNRPGDNYEIYVGHNDFTTRKQEISDEEFEERIHATCARMNIGFCYSLLSGGYVNEDGTYTREKASFISTINPNEEAINALAEELCKEFNQESVLVVKTKAEAYYIAKEVKKQLGNGD